MSGLDAAAVRAVHSAMLSHAESLGVFGRSSDYEPIAPPGRGITCALIEGDITPAPSGLAATSLNWEWTLRLYTPWLAKPESGIDPALTAAAITLMASYGSDIDLTGFGAPPGLVREVSVLKSTISPRWIEQDGKWFRTRDISLTVVINDAYAQAVAA